MMRSELDAINAYLSACDDLLPYCNDDARDTLAHFASEVREHLAAHRAELVAQHNVLDAAERRTAERRCRMHNLRLQLIAGGKP